MTAEEVTAKRRAERQQFKLDRSRALAEAAKEAETVFASTGVVLEESSFVIPSSNTWKPVSRDRGTNTAIESDLTHDMTIEQNILPDEEELVDKEHLQLTLQEAFFLAWTMGCLLVMDPSTVRSMIYTFVLHLNVYSRSLLGYTNDNQTTLANVSDSPASRTHRN